MSFWRTLQDNCGRLYKFDLRGFWAIDLDTKDPQIPNLPLETAEAVGVRPLPQRVLRGPFVGPMGGPLC